LRFTTHDAFAKTLQRLDYRPKGLRTDNVDMWRKPMMHGRHLRCLTLALVAALFPLAAVAYEPQAPEGPFEDLQLRLSTAGLHAPGRVGIAVEDLATGMTSGFNDNASLPAASTIKIPVMIEVFKQMEAGDLDLATMVHLENRDRDWGWGDMADAPSGVGKSIKQLLWLMITRSDNTATNMLIRKVGRTHINQTMHELGLHSTHLGDYIRSETDTIRYALRTSPHDMLTLLDAIARDQMIDKWSSQEMLTILEGQTHNGLLPSPLPKDVKIAHKTGSLHDTLNDVGIVYQAGEPYVIAVMTTQLADLDRGRAFIHRVSRLAYDELGRFATWREDQGIAAFSNGPEAAPYNPWPPAASAIPAPDVQMWSAPAGAQPQGYRGDD
jgi:beta-lactamase class A